MELEPYAGGMFGSDEADHSAEPTGDSSTQEILGSPAQDAGTSNDAPAEKSVPDGTVWFDAKKVPAELQPTFREMQASWTRKTQEAAEAMKWHRSFTEQYGDINEVTSFLDTLRDPDGLRNFVTDLAEKFGLTNAQAAQVAQEMQSPQAPNPQDERSGQTGYNPSDLNAPMTRAEFMAWQQQIQAAEQERQEDAELDGIIRELSIPEELQYHVLAEANRLPDHLGYAERIKRANANVTSLLESHAAKAAAAQQEVATNTPASLAGSMPQGAEEEALTFADAQRLSLQDLRNLKRS